MLTRFREGYENGNPDLHYLLSGLDEKLTRYEGGDLILTDDKAPVELLGMRVIDEMISEQLAYYKESFKGMSLSEMLDFLN